MSVHRDFATARQLTTAKPEELWGREPSSDLQMVMEQVPWSRTQPAFREGAFPSGLLRELLLSKFSPKSAGTVRSLL